MCALFVKYIALFQRRTPKCVVLRLCAMILQYLSCTLCLLPELSCWYYGQTSIYFSFRLLRCGRIAQRRVSVSGEVSNAWELQDLSFFYTRVTLSGRYVPSW